MLVNGAASVNPIPVSNGNGAISNGNGRKMSRQSLHRVDVIESVQLQINSEDRGLPNGQNQVIFPLLKTFGASRARPKAEKSCEFTLMLSLN